MIQIFKKEKQTVGIRDLAKLVKDLQKELKEITKELSDFKKEMTKAITKVGMVRFNPFNEVGGDQSFSIALLDSNNDGIIVTSHYGRDMNRVYSKTIAKGKSSSALSKEEQEAIKKALE